MIKAPNSPVVDPKTGVVTVEWLAWFQTLVAEIGTPSAPAPPSTGATPPTLGDAITIVNDYGSGTPGHLARWQEPRQLTDSIITEAGAIVTVPGMVRAVALQGRLDASNLTGTISPDRLPPTAVSTYDEPLTADGAGLSVFGETPVGAVNDTNTSYTTAATYAAGSLRVHLNGLRQVSGDVAETSANTFTLAFAPTTGDLVRVDYAARGAELVFDSDGEVVMVTGIPL